MEQIQPRGPAILFCFKLPYPFIHRGTYASVLNLVPHSSFISVLTRTLERYQLDQPLFIRIRIACCNPYSRLDLGDDIFAEHPINTCPTPHICDKYLLPIILHLSSIDISHIDINWVGFGAAWSSRVVAASIRRIGLSPAFFGDHATSIWRMTTSSGHTYQTFLYGMFAVHYKSSWGLGLRSGKTTTYPLWSQAGGIP